MYQRLGEHHLCRYFGAIFLRLGVQDWQKFIYTVRTYHSHLPSLPSFLGIIACMLLGPKKVAANWCNWVHELSSCHKEDKTNCSLVLGNSLARGYLTAESQSPPVGVAMPVHHHWPHVWSSSTAPLPSLETMHLVVRSYTRAVSKWPSQRVSKHTLMKPAPSLPALFRARGQRRGFSPGTLARHSQSARTLTDILNKDWFFFFKKSDMRCRWTLILPQTSRANPVQCYSTHQENWDLRFLMSDLMSNFNVRFDVRFRWPISCPILISIYLSDFDDRLHVRFQSLRFSLAWRTLRFS